MTVRALLPLALVVALTSVATAESQKIGILGLEVTGATDFESTTVARNLTTGLRAQVSKHPKYSLAPNSSVLLIDEKVNSSCDTEAATCMAKIGKKLGAQVLLFGHIEKKQQASANGYQLTLKLLDTDTKLATPYTVWIPLADIGGSELDTWASKAFANVTGAIDATTTEPLVIKDPITPKPGKPGGGWRMSAYVSGGLTALLIGGFALTALQTKSYNKHCIEVDKDTTNMMFDSSGEYEPAPGDDTYSKDQCNKTGPLYSKLTYVTGISAALVGGFAIFATYKGYIGNKGSSEKNAGRSTRRKKTFAVTPIVSPDGAGATVRFDW
jgi:hypothetical protein